ncbi:MAG: GNAT family N-acetyltransferase/peptidase C39 family protein [Rhodospirillales bacterium]
MTGPVIDQALPEDLQQLVELENRCFRHDRLSRRSFQHLLTHGHAFILKAVMQDRIVGSAVVLLHRSTPLARLYSLAVDSEARGHQIGRHLLLQAETRALDQGCSFMRLEVRPDSTAALNLYRNSNYRDLGTVPDYYEDGAPAFRMEKALSGGANFASSKAPYYAQTLPFTCGPASLIMAMKAQQPDLVADRSTELAIWRESTTVYMTGGHGGCSADGLALAAHDRGFDVEILINTKGDDVFTSSVREPEKKEVVRLVQQDFRRQVTAAGIAVKTTTATSSDLRAALDDGKTPVVLISHYRLTGSRAPHWVTVTAADDHFIYIHDPEPDPPENRFETDCMNLPVADSELDRMVNYGKDRLSAAIFVSRRK